MRQDIKYIFIALTLLIATSCSTTKALQDNEYRLAKNRVEITNDKDFNPNTLTPYLKQKHRGWTPFLHVYNWTNGKGGVWDKFVKKIGVAPVVYEPDMVDSSIENITNHLDYLGYYGSDVSSDIDVKRRNVNVTYKIRLGKRIPIKDIEIFLPDNAEFSNDFLSDTSAISSRP